MTKYFKEGAKVEIMGDDDGLRGSWFTGSVIQTLKNGKALVEYDTLTDDNGGKKRLREELDLVILRPIPPPEPLWEGGFAVSDEVDAFYNEGWWEGVIIEVLKNGRYSVYFRGTRDQLEFQQSQLRLHREWDGENWIAPCEMVAKLQKKSPSKAKAKPSNLVDKHFFQGAEVEVSSDEDGFAGAWFAATIVGILDEDKYLVEYKNLKDDDDKNFLREEADRQHIRPHPPEVVNGDCFEPFEEVDVLFNDGWWVGVICRILGNHKYEVYFRDTDEVQEYDHCNLRRHQDWVDGKWVMLSQALKL